MIFFPRMIEFFHVRPWFIHDGKCSCFFSILSNQNVCMTRSENVFDMFYYLFIHVLLGRNKKKREQQKLFFN